MFYGVVTLQIDQRRPGGESKETLQDHEFHLRHVARGVNASVTDRVH